MARCRCSNVPCNCVLVPADGIVLSGNGTTETPWIISAPSRSTGTVRVLDSPTLDLSMTGAGSVADPYVISGATAVAGGVEFVDTSDIGWTLSGVGTQTDPLVVRADIVNGFAPVVVKSTPPVPADYHEATIPLHAVWIQSP